jgi:hypothetical protein
MASAGLTTVTSQRMILIPQFAAGASTEDWMSLFIFWRSCKIFSNFSSPTAVRIIDSAHLFNYTERVREIRERHSEGETERDRERADRIEWILNSISCLLCINKSITNISFDSNWNILLGKTRRRTDTHGPLSQIDTKSNFIEPRDGKEFPLLLNLVKDSHSLDDHHLTL